MSGGRAARSGITAPPAGQRAARSCCCFNDQTDQRVRVQISISGSELSRRWSASILVHQSFPADPEQGDPVPSARLESSRFNVAHRNKDRSETVTVAEVDMTSRCCRFSVPRDVCGQRRKKTNKLTKNNVTILSDVSQVHAGPDLWPQRQQQHAAHSLKISQENDETQMKKWRDAKISSNMAGNQQQTDNKQKTADKFVCWRFKDL